MTEENRDWGYRRIQSALSNLGHKIACSTIADILQRHEMEAAPERSRKATWKEFLSRHWELTIAADFFTVRCGPDEDYSGSRFCFSSSFRRERSSWV
jgi:putative transposase